MSANKFVDVLNDVLNIDDENIRIDFYHHNNLLHHIVMIDQYNVYFDIEIDLNFDNDHRLINHREQILIQNQMIDF